MKKPARARGELIAVDGLNAAAVKTAAKARLAAIPRSRRGGISHWGASGVFDDLVVAGEEAGHASARTLLLLYAADLAFRLRWEIRPAIAEGRTVAAASYVATGIAFGRAAGLSAGWLADVFAFAIRPDAALYVDAAPSRGAPLASFIEFGCDQLVEGGFWLPRRTLTDRARKHLQMAARRQS